MALVNIDCPECAEPMWIEAAADACWDYFPGSVEMKQLFALVAERVEWVWQCANCGHFDAIRQGRVTMAA